MPDYHPLTLEIPTILEAHNCWFEIFEHKPVSTSEEAAQLRHGYSLEQGAKALIVNLKQQSQEELFCMLVIPGNRRFDKKKVLNVTETKSVRFATVEELSNITNGVLPGGVPPFGNLFGLKVIVDPSLLQHEKMIFNAGDRSFSIAMNTCDYLKIIKPVIFSIVE